MTQLNQRIGWEIASEYGFQTRIGRTLEKTGSSVAYPDMEKWHPAVDRLRDAIQNEIGILRSVHQDALVRFLLGFFMHLKVQGGIYQPVLDSFIDSLVTPFVLKRKHWMPNFGPNSRTPSFLTTQRGTRFDQLFSASTSRVTWYQHRSLKRTGWYHTHIIQAPLSSQRFSPVVVSAMQKKGILGVISRYVIVLDQNN